MSLRRLSAVLAVVGMLAACGNDTTAEPPAELVDISTTLPVHRLWSAGLGGDGEILRLMLGVEGRGDTVYAAGRDGDVRALDAATGKVRWNTDTDLALSAGPGPSFACRCNWSNAVMRPAPIWAGSCKARSGAATGFGSSRRDERRPSNS